MAFTIFKPVSILKPEISIIDTPIDILDWAIGVTESNLIIPKGRIFGNSQMILPITTYIPDEYYSLESRAEYAKQFFLNKAKQANIPLLDYQAAAIVGNFMWESGSKDLNTKAIGDSGASIGIAQWQDSRRRDLMAFANEYNLDVNNLDTQLEFAWYEMTKGKEAKLYKPLEKLLKTTSLENATEVFMDVYERPSKKHLKERISFAKSLIK